MKPFEDYLTMTFEERTARPMCFVHNDNKALPYDLLKLHFFHPTRVDIRESHDLSCQIGEVAASRFVVEFCDPGKATSAYLSSIDGKKSKKVVSKQERLATMNCDASNSQSESGHALVKIMKKICDPTARCDGLGAVGQSQGNNGFGHGSQALVTGKKAKEGNEVVHERGEFHKLLPELQASLVQTGKEMATNGMLLTVQLLTNLLLTG